MSIDPSRVVETLIRPILYGEHDQQPREGRPPVITLSRDHGAGGEEIARSLAEGLGLHLYDKELLDAVADAAKVDRELMARLDERLTEQRESWIFAFLSGRGASLTAYRHYLVNITLLLSEHGGVFMGRGLHIVLRDHGAFRVRIAGSELRCAERVAARTGLSRESAEEEVRRINAERERFLEETFHHKLHDATQFDLIVNTDRYPDLSAVSALIRQAREVAQIPVSTFPGQS